MCIYIYIYTRHPAASVLCMYSFSATAENIPSTEQLAKSSYLSQFIELPPKRLPGLIIRIIAQTLRLGAGMGLWKAMYEKPFGAISLGIGGDEVARVARATMAPRPHPSIDRLMHVSVNLLSGSTSSNLSICLSISPCIHLSIHPSIHLSVCLSIY